MKKFRRRCLGFVLAASLVVGSLVTGVPVQATGKTTSKVDTDELDQKRQDTLDKIAEIKDDISDVKKKIKNLEKSKSNLQSYINQLDDEASALDSQMQDTQAKIEAKQADIALQEEELAKTQQTADEQYENMKIRIQYMYENGTVSFLEALLTAKSLSEVLNRIDYITQMSIYDRNMMDDYVAARDAVAEHKALLEAEEQELQLLSDSLKEQKEAVDLLIETKSREIAQYQSQINEANSDAKDYQAELLKQEKALEEVEEAIAAAAAAAAGANDGDGGASGLLWPCPGSKRITSYFGPRKAPVKGASTYHKGIDVGAPTGTAIIASAGGVVTTATYSRSAGNYIVISHGGGLSTVYMHCSKLYVSVGEQVEKGENIAAVGSTGYSTGPHLHYGIIKNGSYVNPLDYVG